MNSYRLRFSIMTCRVSVHALDCKTSQPVRAGGHTHLSGDSLWDVEADSAKAAALAQDAEFVAEEREMPKTKICNCTKGK